MSKDQITRILKIGIVATLFMLISEIIFDIPAIQNFFSNWVQSTSGWTVYLVIWLLMFLQTNLLQIPALTVLSASVAVGINTLSFTYIIVVITAYMVGCILTYWLGRWFGTKATRWVAGDEQEFQKWCTIINEKGKWWYFATVILPIFPDDILCLVAGSVKMNFGFYTIVNCIGRTVGLITMLLTLKLIGTIGQGFPILLIVWIIALIVEVVFYCILRRNKDGK